MRAQMFGWPPLGKILNIMENTDGLSLVDASFATRGSARPAFCFGSCHLLPLVMAVAMIPNVHSFTRHCERYYSWEGNRVFLLELQPVAKVRFGKIAVLFWLSTYFIGLQHASCLSDALSFTNHGVYSMPGTHAPPSASW